MSDQYLWDKTGAPDAEIEQLEAALGSLRYRPSLKSKERILDATNDATPCDMVLATQHIADKTSASTHRVMRFRAPSAVAIAATLLLAIVAGGLWVKWGAPQSIKTSELQQAASRSLPPDTASKIRSRYPADDLIASAATTQNNLPKHTQTLTPSHKKQRRFVFENQSMPVINRVANSPQSGKNNNALIVEGEHAKEQLVMALYIASEKLNFAQKKIQANKDRVPAS